MRCGEYNKSYLGFGLGRGEESIMLTHKGTQVLRTERLTLRPFRLSDAEAMFRTWANDERVTRFLTWQPHGTPEVTRTLL